MRKSHFNSQRYRVPRTGFTLLELLVVVGILASLVALALPFYQDYVNETKVTAARADLTTFRKALIAHDQLEPHSYNACEFLGLIGKYLQDYRPAGNPSTVTNPVDPWGNEYHLDHWWGVIWSNGPNGLEESESPISLLPLTGGDDIGLTWKPGFYISDVQQVGTNRLRVIFSRRLLKTYNPNGEAGQFSTDGAGNPTGISAIMDSNTSCVITLNTSLAAGVQLLTCAANVPSDDGLSLSPMNTDPFGNPANQKSFTAQ